MFALYEKIKGMIDWLIGVKIIKRTGSLIIEDRRPTWPMLLSIVGAFVFSVIFGLRFLFGSAAGVDSFGMWSLGLAAIVCVALSFRGTLREVYVFDKVSDTYRFTRRYIYKKDVIEGTISQFRGVGVRTDEVDESTKHAVVLRQDGLLLGASPEQPIRESKPALNFWNTEARIAQAIHKFLDIPRVDAE